MVLMAPWLVFVLLPACSGIIGGQNTSYPGASKSDRALEPYMRRLSNNEYRNSVADLLKIAPSAVDAATSVLPTENTLSGFDNDVAVMTMSFLQLQGYHLSARNLSALVLGDAAQRNAFLGCDLKPNTRATCVPAFIRAWGRRVYRRPITDDEVESLVTLAANETDPTEAVSVMMQAMLQSPHFLFKVEQGTTNVANGERTLSGYELATRMSYLLWQSTPDDVLLDAAQSGKLDSDAGLQSEAERLLNSERAKTTLQAFAGQWFGFDKLPRVGVSTQSYPEYNPALVSSMQGEVERLLAHYMFTEGANFLDIYSSKKTYIDSTLAQTIYQVPEPSNVDADGFGEVDFSNDPNRGGLLATAAFLTLTESNHDVPSPVPRGKFVRNLVFCKPVPAPAVQPPPLKIMEGENANEAESRHTSDPACTGCHTLLDPIGHGLERYDSIGRVNAVGGTSLTRTGHIEGISTVEFSGGYELGTVVRDIDLTTECTVSQFTQWATGGVISTNADDALGYRAWLTERFAAEGSTFKSLLLEFVTSRAFRKIRN